MSATQLSLTMREEPPTDNAKITSQSPAPGTTVKPSTPVEVSFALP